MYKRLALLLLMASPSVYAIDMLESYLKKLYKDKLVFILQHDEQSDLSAMPDDVKKYIVLMMVQSIKSEEHLTDKRLQEVFLD
jgi:hypothetical protein